MKTTKQVLFGFAVACILVTNLTSCSQKKVKANQEKETLVEAPKQIIPISEAAKEYKEYSQRRVPLIQKFEDSINLSKFKQKTNQNNNTNTDKSEPKKFDVARYVYYDYQTLRQYMDYIEQQTKGANQEISTIRFYFAEYSDDTYFPNGKDSIKHPRQNTLVITPAIKRKDKNNKDYIYYIDDSDAANPQVVFINDEFNPIKEDGLGINIGQQEKSQANLISNPFSKPSTSLYYSGTSVTLNRSTGVPPPKPNQ